MPDGQRIQLNLLAEPVPVGATRSKPPLSLAQVKVLKRADIRKAFEAASNANVTIDGVVYQGGYEKAMRLDAAKRLAELAGQTTTTFYDLANVGHTLTIAQATSVVLAISVAFQTEFARKQARMVAIDAAATAADVDVIVY
ncbi:MAG: hypothetical protein B7Y56_03380 [Gallionellales bacterium 35-53-114]|nr:MAG: hypothetical protein B7Y56_03380 [Gallionellales bacterium 35-53-114]OZB08055.1 MAG: hypothetical protein B7X61_10990 [Gallionellales bacterium 39-52-133]